MPMLSNEARGTKTSPKNIPQIENKKNVRVPSHRASQKVSRCSFDSKLRRASFEGIGVRFYEILPNIKTTLSHRASQKVSRHSFDSKLRRASLEGIGIRFYEVGYLRN